MCTGYSHKHFNEHGAFTVGAYSCCKNAHKYDTWGVGSDGEISIWWPGRNLRPRSCRKNGLGNLKLPIISIFLMKLCNDIWYTGFCMQQTVSLSLTGSMWIHPHHISILVCLKIVPSLWLYHKFAVYLFLPLSPPHQVFPSLLFTTSPDKMLSHRTELIPNIAAVLMGVLSYRRLVYQGRVISNLSPFFFKGGQVITGLSRPWWFMAERGRWGTSRVCLTLPLFLCVALESFLLKWERRQQK